MLDLHTELFVERIEVLIAIFPGHVDPLSPSYGATSLCRWDRRLANMEVALNILNTQSQIADKRWSSDLGVGREVKKLLIVNVKLQKLAWGHRLGRIFWNDLSNRKLVGFM
jgi:hypothetical protein